MKRHRSEDRGSKKRVRPSERVPIKKRNISVPSSSSRQLVLDNSCDFLCDRTIIFNGTGHVQNVIALELAEKSPFFAAVLRYHDLRDPIFLPEFLSKPFLLIQEYIRHGVIKLSAENVIETLLAADYMLLGDLRNQCMQELRHFLLTNVAFASQVWTQSYHLKLANITEMAFEILLENFQDFVETREFLELSRDQVHELLSNDMLNAGDERSVFNAALAWISAYADRKAQADHVLSSCRLGIMAQNDIMDIADTVHIIEGTRFRDLLRYWPLSLKNGNLDLNLEKCFSHRVPHEAIFVFGGWCENTGPKAAVQVYNVKTNQWCLWSNEDSANGESSAPSNQLSGIPTRVYAGCVYVADTIYLIGGYDGSQALKTTVCYDFSRPELGWHETSCMYERRYYVSVAYLQGFIYAAGGHNGETRGRLGSAERYDISENTWRPIASMNHIRSDASAASLNQRVYVCGGFEGRRYHNSVECYNPEVNEWSLVQTMTHPRGGVALIEYQGALYAVGGNNGTTRLKSIERYDVVQNTWHICGEMIHQKSNLSLAVMGTHFYIIGGWSDEPNTGIMSSVERYNVLTGQCEPVRDLCFPASATCACTVNGRRKIQHHIKQWNPILTPSVDMNTTSPTDRGEIELAINSPDTFLTTNRNSDIDAEQSMLSTLDVTSLNEILHEEAQDPHQQPGEEMDF